MNVRVVLTAIWIGSFVAALAIVESYVGRHDADGMLILLDEDRMDAMRPIVVLFGSYVSGLLGFWFLRPLPKAKHPRGERVRERLALACTLLFNAALLYLLCGEHLHPGVNALRMIRDAAQAAGWMSLLVAPVNLYYFGMKSSAPAGA